MLSLFFKGVILIDYIKTHNNVKNNFEIINEKWMMICK